MSKSIVLYLHMHQPYRVRYYGVHEIAKDHNYFNAAPYERTDNYTILRKVVEKSYKPTLETLQTILDNNVDFSCSLSITGTLIEQLQIVAPEILDSVQKLVQTGRVEIVAESYYHSLAFFLDQAEFDYQVNKHVRTIKALFGVTPKAFRNTELAYNDKLSEWAEQAGFATVLAEGWDPILGWRSPNYVYQAPNEKTKLLLKNYHLSDDVAFRFSDKEWAEYPLTAEKYATWVADSYHGDIINLFMDFETFGEHQWSSSGIFEFLVSATDLLYEQGHTFMTVSEAANSHSIKDTVSMPNVVTWADTERDLSAWIGNKMQKDALVAVYKLAKAVNSSKDKQLIDDWRKLQTSDHFYYMCTKYFNDGDVHKYFSPYETPYEGFIAYMNAINDMKFRLGIT